MNEQLDLFGFAPSQYIIKKPIRLIELFAGIGAQSKALEVLKANFESYKIAEWSKESIKAYTYIHHYEEIKNCNDKEINSLSGISRNYNEPMTKEQINNLKEDEKILLTNCKKITHNLIDISKVKGEDLNIVDTDKYEYVLTFSFPCTDLSLAGKGLGMEEGSGTRSSLLWEVERLLKECKEKGNLPNTLLMENVPQVIGTKNKSSFHKFMKRLEDLGYKNFVKVLNAKDFYIPQNRQRCFMVSILTKEDVFSFPNKMKLDYYLLDFLDKEVDEKYYLSDKMINFFNENSIKQKEKGNGFQFKPTTGNVVAKTITTRSGSRMDDNFIICKNKRLNETLEKIDNVNEVPLFLDTYNQKTHSKIVGTITTRVSSSNNSFLLVPENTKKGYAEAKVGDGVYINRPHQKRGVVQKGMIQTIKTSCDDIGVVVEENSMKKTLCNKLIESGKVREGDVIRHSYSKNRIEEIDNGKYRKENTNNNICPTLETRCDCLGVCVDDNKYLGTYEYSKSNNFMQNKSRFKPDKKVSNTLLASGNNNGIVVLGNYGTDEPKVIGGIGEKKSNNGTQWFLQDRIYDNKIAPAICTSVNPYYLTKHLRIRKLTPCECYKLMGFTQRDYERCAKIQSNATIYHQAGDSIVVTVLIAIFGKLLGLDYEKVIKQYVKGEILNENEYNI